MKGLNLFTLSFLHMFILLICLVLFESVYSAIGGQCVVIDTIQEFNNQVIHKLYDEICLDKKQNDAESIEICVFMHKIMAYSQSIIFLIQQNDEKNRQLINKHIDKLTTLIEGHFAKTKQQIEAKLSLAEVRKEIEFVAQLANGVGGEQTEQQQNDGDVIKKLDEQLKKNLETKQKFNAKLLKGKTLKDDEEFENLKLSYQIMLIYERVADQLMQAQKCEATHVGNEQHHHQQQVGAVSAPAAAAAAGTNLRRRRKRCVKCCTCCGVDYGHVFRGFFKFFAFLFGVTWKVVKTIGYLAAQGIGFILCAFAGTCFLASDKRPISKLYFCCKEPPTKLFELYNDDNLLPKNYGEDQEGCSCWSKMGRNIATDIWEKRPSQPAADQAQQQQQQPPSGQPYNWQNQASVPWNNVPANSATKNPFRIHDILQKKMMQRGMPNNLPNPNGAPLYPTAPPHNVARSDIQHGKR